jgi:hypothetical protein
MADLLVDLHADRDRDQRTRAAVATEQWAQRARVHCEATPWWRPITRWRAGKELGRREAARGDAALAPADLHCLAGVLIDRAVQVLRTDGGKYASTKHRLHPEVDAYWSLLVADVADEVATIAAQLGALAWSGSRVLERYCANDLPPLAELLTPAAVTDYLERERALVRSVAANREMATRYRQDGVLIVQHVASGLRAEFTPGLNLPGPGLFGSIFAKHYSIADIAPNEGADRDTRFFEGLGIGEMIYRHGASRFPGTRWPGGSTADSAGALRRRLHQTDPYVWGVSSCTTCSSHFKDDQDWNNGAQTDFPPH